MKCRKARKLLGPYLDGELPGSRAAELEDHLAECAECQERLTELQELGEDLADAAPVPPVPSGLEERIISAAKKSANLSRPDRSRPEHWAWSGSYGGPGHRLQRRPAMAWIWAAGLATVAAAVALAWALHVPMRQRNLQPEPARIALVRSMETYGIDLFDPMPPGSLASAYADMLEPLSATQGWTR